ncbi:MAG: hypothetical protein HY236_12380 [Acidobacteria bacterium]|nr:hypothetical protein [Acidobacteriota bacterium]
MPESTLEVRIAGLEGSYKELTKRIDDLRSEMHRGFDGVRAEMDHTRTGLEAQMADLRAEFRTSFRWAMSLILVNWLSLMAGIFLVVARK